MIGLKGRGKGSLYNPLGSFHYPLQCFVVGDRVASMPDCDTVSQDALNCTAVETDHDVSRHMTFLQFSQEE